MPKRGTKMYSKKRNCRPDSFTLFSLFLPYLHKIHFILSPPSLCPLPTFVVDGRTFSPLDRFGLYSPFRPYLHSRHFFLSPPKMCPWTSAPRFLFLLKTKSPKLFKKPCSSSSAPSFKGRFPSISFSNQCLFFSP